MDDHLYKREKREVVGEEWYCK